MTTTPFRHLDPKLAALRAQPLFAGLSRRETREIAALFDLIAVDSGREVVRQGEFGREFCVLVSGVASVRRDGRVIASLTDGDHFGEMSLLEGRRVATVTAVTPLVVLVAFRTAFATLLDGYPTVGAAVLRSAIERGAALGAAA